METEEKKEEGDYDAQRPKKVQKKKLTNLLGGGGRIKNPFGGSKHWFRGEGVR